MDIPTELIDLARRIKEIQDRTKMQEDDWRALEAAVDLAEAVVAGYERRLASVVSPPSTLHPPPGSVLRCPFLSSHLSVRSSDLNSELRTPNSELEP